MVYPHTEIEFYISYLITVAYLLQTKKMSDIDQLNKDQEVKFLNYVSGMDNYPFLSLLIYLFLCTMCDVRGLRRKDCALVYTIE